LTFVIGFGGAFEDACNFQATATVTGDNPVFCNCTQFTGAVFAAVTFSGTYRVSDGINYVEVFCTSGDPVAPVTATCQPCPGGTTTTSTTTTTTSGGGGGSTTTTTTSTTTTTAAPVGLFEITNTSSDLDLSGLTIGGTSVVLTSGSFPSTPFTGDILGTTQLIAIPGTYDVVLVGLTSGTTGQSVRVTDSNGAIQTQSIANPFSDDVTFTNVFVNDTDVVLIELLP
jgi:hypothetical protein